MSAAEHALERQGKPSIDSHALRVPAYPAPEVERAPVCAVGVIHMFGTGWSSSYQMKTATWPALYALLLSTGWTCALAQLSTVVLPQSWPSLHSVGVMNAKFGSWFGLN